MQKKFFYLHGLNSAFDSEEEKIQTLNSIGKVDGITYNTFSTYNDTREFLIRNVPHDESQVLVGTDIGGFWASEMSKIIGCPSILINPCYKPIEVLQRFENVTIENSRTGKISCMYSSCVNSYDDKEIPNDKSEFSHSPLVLIDRGDEVVNSITSQNALDQFEVHVFSGGCHRFNHMEESLPIIENYVRSCALADAPA